MDSLGERRDCCDLPADTGASDSDADLANLEILARLYALGAGFGRSHPEVMVGVGVDANVGLEGDLDFDRCRVVNS